MSKKTDSETYHNKGRSQTALFHSTIDTRSPNKTQSTRGDDEYQSPVKTTSDDQTFFGPRSPTSPNGLFLNSSLIDISTLDRNSSVLSMSPRESSEIERRGRILSSEAWHNDISCYSCKILFKTLQGVRRHHCRLCAKSVCGDCSSRRISGERACDVCYIKHTDTEGAARRDEFMARVEYFLQEKTAEVDYLENLHREKENEVLKMHHETKLHFEETQRKCDIQEAESKRWDVMLKKKLKAKSEFQGILKEAQEMLRDRLQEYTELSKKIKMNQVELTTRTNYYNQKIEQLAALTQAKVKLEDRLKNQQLSNRGGMTISVISASDCGFQDSIIRAGNEGGFNSSVIHGSPDRNFSASVIAYQRSSLVVPTNRAQSFIDEPKQKGGGMLCGVGFGGCK